MRRLVLLLVLNAIACGSSSGHGEPVPGPDAATAAGDGAPDRPALDVAAGMATDGGAARLTDARGDSGPDGLDPRCPPGLVWCLGCTPGTDGCAMACMGNVCPRFLPDAGAGGGFCPGVSTSAPAGAGAHCATHVECGGGGFSMMCLTAAPVYACGGPAPPHECRTDPECGAGRVCVSVACGGFRCLAACPSLPCAATEDCAQGHCVPRRCDMAGAAACAAGWTCRPAEAAGADRGCVPDRCGPAPAYACPAGWDCQPGGTGADPHGCTHRRCAADRDCACGSCVNGLCEGSPGYCFRYAPPP